jgi:Dolichyl-phosphate-mannose-protein mannosyltransferase
VRHASIGRLPLLTRPVLIAAVLGLALFLRAWRIRHGLPDFLEEALPFRIALAMRDGATGHIDWNPHLFQFPSLTVYLHLAVQQVTFLMGSWLGHYRSWADYQVAYHVDPTPMVLAARSLGIVFDMMAVAAVMRIGRRLWPGAGLVAGLIVACSPAMIFTARSIHVETLMTALSLWALERMLNWHAKGDPKDLGWAAVLIGLATGAHYPAATLVLPLAWLMWDREREQGKRAVLRHWAGTCGVCLTVFLVTTPFALFDFPTMWRDWTADRGAGGNHLWMVAQRSFGFHASQLARNLGALGAILCIASPVVTAFEPRARRMPIAALWFTLLCFLIPISIARIDAERFILPVLATAALLAAATMFACLRPFHRGARAGFVGILAVLIGSPLIVHGLRAGARGSDTTQIQARRWCERHLKPTDLLVQEGYSARLPTGHQVAAVRASGWFQKASPEWRERLEDVRTYRVVALPFAVSGSITEVVRLPNGKTRELDVLPHAEQLNQVYYDPRLFDGVDYFMTSSSVRDRYLADTKRFPVQSAFYRLLDTAGEEVVRFTPRGVVDGPEIVVRKLGSRYRAAILARGGLDSLWWTRCVPREYRDLVTALLDPTHEAEKPSRLPEPVAQLPDSGIASLEDSLALEDLDLDEGSVVPAASDLVASEPVRRPILPKSEWTEDEVGMAPWVGTLTTFYDRRVRAFAELMAVQLAETGQWEAARRFALATRVMHPDDEAAAIMLSVTSRHSGQPQAARAVIEHALDLRPPEARGGGLLLEYAHALRESGDRVNARLVLTALAEAPVGNVVGDEARRLLATQP